MSSQVQPIGTLPSAYRLITPALTVDASGGTVEVDGNTKFNTNIPLDRYMLITVVNWYLTTLALPQIGTGAYNAVWHQEFQLSEALARTVVTFADPVYVGDGLVECAAENTQST